MMNTLNVFLVWSLFICVVIFISDNNAQTSKTKIPRKILLPSIVLPKIVFKTVSFAKPSIIPAEVIEPQSLDPQSLDPLNLIQTSANTESATEIAKEQLKQETHVEDVVSEEDIEVLSDINPDEDAHLETMLNFLNDDQIDISILTANHEENHDENDTYEKEDIIQDEDSGIWTENLNSDSLEIDFDPNAFYSDVSSITCEVSSSTF